VKSVATKAPVRAQRLRRWPFRARVAARPCPGIKLWLYLWPVFVLLSAWSQSPRTYDAANNRSTKVVTQTAGGNTTEVGNYTCYEG
jgi:hypothetical protein